MILEKSDPFSRLYSDNSAWHRNKSRRHTFYSSTNMLKTFRLSSNSSPEKLFLTSSLYTTVISNNLKWGGALGTQETIINKKAYCHNYIVLWEHIKASQGRLKSEESIGICQIKRRGRGRTSQSEETMCTKLRESMINSEISHNFYMTGEGTQTMKLEKYK